MNNRKYLIFLSLFFFIAQPVSADLIDDLRAQLDQKRKAVDNIDDKIKEFQSSIQKKKSEAKTLQDQIGLINDDIKSITLEIDKTQARIEETNAESEATKEEIKVVNKKIEQEKLVLQEYLRTLQLVHSDNVIESFFKYSTLSEAISQLRAIYRAEQNSQLTIDKIKGLQSELQDRQTMLNDLQRELDGLMSRQAKQKGILNEQQGAKQKFLVVTKQQEQEFQKMLATAVAEQKRANAEITRLDSQIRAELEKQGYKRLGSVGKLDWPVDPIFGISCGFHCMDYPFAELIGPHTGIDMPINMGTPIRAAADGYVAKVQIASGTGFSYILIIHGDNVSTMYGHVSGASVKEGTYITRGQVIGSTGGAPGTRGAGLSTGPHLHFEVRKNGIPVNGLPYLPPSSS